MKRILSILLCALMVVAIIPMSVFMVSAEDEVEPLYENDFSSAEKVAEGTTVGSSATYSDGKLAFAAGNGNSHWSKTVALNGTDGTITVSATVYPNWQSADNPALTVNGKTVVWNAGGYKVKLGDDTTAYNSVTNAAVYVTVTINPQTGDAKVVYDQSAAGYTTRETDVNVGTIGSTLDVKFGYAVNGWSADDLKVTQAKGNKLDTTTRAEYGYYKNDFTNATGSGVIGATTINSTVVDGALKVQPSETNQWNVGFSNFPSDSIVSFKFMIPELLEQGTTVNLLYNRSISNYLIKVSAGEATNVVSMNIGAESSSANVAANEWCTVTIVMTADGSTVYCNGTLLGTSTSTFAGRDAGWGLFNFNNATTDNTVTYYIDDLSISTVADETFVKVTGYQKTNVADGKYNVRFTAAIPELYAGQENVGFEIVSDANGKSWDKSTTTVYNSLTANFGTETVNASDLGAKYVTAMAITGIPADLGTVELVVKPYVTINGVKFYGSAVTVTVNPVTE